jgi:hypothetical protein
VLRALRTRPRTQVAVVGTALAAVLAGGTTAAALAPRPAAEPVRATAVPERLAEVPRTTVVPEQAAPPSPVPAPAAPVAVAPLAALHIPDVVVRSASPLSPATVQALQALDGVTGLALLDAGPVVLEGAQVRVAGVDPSQFRAFAPQESAASDPLWQAVARGELAVTPGLAQQRSLPLGGTVDAGGAPARIGAIAVFGPASGEVLATREVARTLGAVPDSIAVLSAPEVKRSVLEKAVRALAGDAEVEMLRPADVAPSRMTGKPRDYRELYIDSARYCPGLSWTVLAAIGQVESAHGKHLGPSSAGALGPMQFLPATWAAYGVDGDGDGVRDIMNPYDAVPGAANYLCRSGAQNGEQGLYNAIFAYNHADWYVRKVLGLAAQYR